MAYSIPEVVMALNGLPAKAKQETLDKIAANFGALVAPPKPEQSLEDIEAARIAKIQADAKAEAAAENERRRTDAAQKEIMGALNTLGSDDLKIAMSAIAANCGVSSVAPEPEPEPEEEEGLDTLSKAELIERAEEAGVEVKSAMTKDDLIQAIKAAEK